MAYSNQPNSYNPAVRNRRVVSVISNDERSVRISSWPAITSISAGQVAVTVAGPSNQLQSWTVHRYYGDEEDEESVSTDSSASSYWNDYHQDDDNIWLETRDLMDEPEMEAIGLRYMGESWVVALQDELFEPYFKEIARAVYHQRMIDPFHVSPYPERVFNWTQHCNFMDTRVVIVAQDPYFDPRLAQGQAFSVENYTTMPRRSMRSLTNIAKAVAYSMRGYPIHSPDLEPPTQGDLTPWAEQGVVLLNTCLTVGSEAESHSDIGWQLFTDAVINYINHNCSNVVFMLWGKMAKAKKNLIDQTRHRVLQTTHPSPRSAKYGFFHCNHFRKANEYLLDNENGPAIDWCGAFWPKGLPFY